MNRTYVFAAVALMVAGCSDGKKDARSDAADAPRIDVAAVLTDSVTLYKEYPGTLTADRTADVYCRVNGYVSRPRYTGGDFVREGEVLFTIDAPDMLNAVNEAEAELATARSQNEYAEQHYLAVAKAFESQAVSKMEVAEALSARDQSRAAIRSAEAGLADARQKLGYCTVRAPFSGYISTNVHSGGSYVNGEGSPVVLATVYDDATVTANFAIEDDSFLQMFENPDPATRVDHSAIPVTFGEELPHTYTADLSYLAPNIDPSTGTIILQAAIANPHHELRSGMYCTLRMPYRVEPRALLVRDASLSTDQLGRYLYVVNDSNRVVYTPVKVGDAVHDSLRVITEGLRPGDRYVTSAMLKVHDGMKVTPVTTNP